MTAKAGFRDDAGWTRRATSSDEGGVRALGDALVVTMHYRAMWGEERTVVARRVASDDRGSSSAPRRRGSSPPFPRTPPRVRRDAPLLVHRARARRFVRAKTEARERRLRRGGGRRRRRARKHYPHTPLVRGGCQRRALGRPGGPSFVAFDPDERGGDDVSRA